MTILSPKFFAPHKTPKDCYIVIGNHTSYHGIGEIIYSLEYFFSQRYNTKISKYVVPNQMNVIIDDFSNPELVNFLRECKAKNPDTHFIVLATEFITHMSLFGLPLGKTFNCFRLFDNPRDLLKLIAWKLGIKKTPPYLHARYLGFIETLKFIDLVVCAHPNIHDTMKRIPNELAQLPSKPMTLYPEFDFNIVAHDPRLYTRPFGFVMSGTLTKFRQKLIKLLITKFQSVAYYQPLYKYLSFSDSTCFNLDKNNVDYGYNNPPPGSDNATKTDTLYSGYIFNFNPPQYKNWGYSSPMRILRAILLGQIPVITRKFGDHPIEDAAVLLTDTPSSLRRMIVDAGINRQDMINNYLVKLASYNAEAHALNAPIREFLDVLDEPNKFVHAQKQNEA